MFLPHCSNCAKDQSQFQTFGVHMFVTLQSFVILTSPLYHQPELPSLCTLSCLINVHRTSINFKDFSHQYLLIRDRTFIKFVSMISQTKNIALFCKKYSTLRVYSLVSSTQCFYLDPYVYCFQKIFQPVHLFGPVRLLGT